MAVNSSVNYNPYCWCFDSVLYSSSLKERSQGYDTICLMKVGFSCRFPSHLRLDGPHHCRPKSPTALLVSSFLLYPSGIPRLFSKDMASNLVFSTCDWIYASIVGVIPKSFRYLLWKFVTTPSHVRSQGYNMEWNGLEKPISHLWFIELISSNVRLLKINIFFEKNILLMIHSYFFPYTPWAHLLNCFLK
jgi:hypothetical protein